MQHTEAYFSQEVNAECRGEIKELVDAKDEGALEERLGCRLAFGTAGLRGPMRGGYNGMNDLVMIQTTQGLASYLVEQFGEQEVKDRGVIIGYDHRKKGSLSSLTFTVLRSCVSEPRHQGVLLGRLGSLLLFPLVS